MIFKYIGGDSSSPTADVLWNSSDTLSENIIAALDTTSTYQGNYKNRIVQSWQTFNPQEVSPEVGIFLYKPKVSTLWKLVFKLSVTNTFPNDVL